MISIDKKILWCYYILTAWKYKKNPLKTKKSWNSNKKRA